MTPALPDRLVLYDGVCGFCDGVVQWLLRHDPARRFRYAPLQGLTAAALAARYPDMPTSLDTVCFLEGGRLLQRSEAAFAIVRHLPAPWSWLRVFAWLPRGLTDFGYDRVASVRYRIWGKKDACRIPTAAERACFLP